MVKNSNSSDELADWLSEKPYWEKYTWHLCLSNSQPTDEDINRCYEYLKDELGISSEAKQAQVEFSLSGRLPNTSLTDAKKKQIRLLEIKDCEGVNALVKTCAVKFGPNLTIVFGGNGSGKSGLGRMLANACFSRGSREILPNLKNNQGSIQGKAEATFVLEDVESGDVNEIRYRIGELREPLKRFAVFDSKSVLIHLDKPNSLSFTPSQIKIFDRVASLLGKLEDLLTQETNIRKRDNPFVSMFSESDTSDVAMFCKSVNSATTDDELIAFTAYEPAEIQKLEAEIDAKKKLDVANKKTELTNEVDGLLACKTSLLGILNYLSAEWASKFNTVLSDLLVKKEVAASIGAMSFDDGLFKKVGSAEWKSLLTAAKLLLDAEAIDPNSDGLKHCLLCHEELTQSGKRLFSRYWEFLESKAEGELLAATSNHSKMVKELQSARQKAPQFLPTDAGISALKRELPHVLDDCRTQMSGALELMDEWIEAGNALTELSSANLPKFELDKIQELADRKEQEKQNLSDPTNEISRLTQRLASLHDRKKLFEKKDVWLDYLKFLRWNAKAKQAGFAGIKTATTRKRREFFDSAVSRSYRDILNAELNNLGCEFRILMRTSGEQGNTVKDFKLDFADKHVPSQILSEGEQKACSLADFLTEIQLDGQNCGIVFDDPVSSLDHDRKRKIAFRLADEALKRQVIVFTHDLVFVGILVEHCLGENISVQNHWIQVRNGIPGHVFASASPKVANLKFHKHAVQSTLEGFDLKTPDEQETAIGLAVDSLRSACEALVVEVLFAKSVQRWDDHIQMSRLSEAIFDEGFALKIVKLHGELSEILPGHNISDVKREKPLSLEELKLFRRKFEELETEAGTLRAGARKRRDSREKADENFRQGW